jgi:hypothetical protein
MSNITIDSLSVRQLFGWFDQRSLAIPEVQREFVWNAKRACALLDSIYRSYPIGTVMIWRTGRERQTMLRHTLHVLPAFDASQNKQILFLLDGQQRLSVLHNVRDGGTVTNESGREIRFGDIFFSLDDDDDSRFISLRRHDPARHFRVADLLRGICKPKAAYKRRVLAECRRRLLEYRVPVVFTDTKEVEHVRQTFIRINAQGMRIKESDKAFSLAQKVGPLHRYHNLRSQMAAGFSELSKEIYWNTLVLARGHRSLGQKSIFRLSRDIEKTDEGEQWFKKQEPHLANAIRKACDYLQHTLDVRSMDFLPSENMIAVLALFFHANGAQPTSVQARQIRLWFWYVAVAQRYVGASYERHIIDDADFFTILGQKRKGTYRIQQRVPMNKIRLGIYNAGGALPKAYRLLLMRCSPRYISNGEPIPLDETSASGNRKQLHHIFPKAVLKNTGIGEEQQNLMCNICYLVAHDNQSFGGKPPVAYLEDYRRKKHFARVMKSHLIPYTPDSPLWGANIKRAFRQFLDERSIMIARTFAEAAGAKLFE